MPSESFAAASVRTLRTALERREVSAEELLDEALSRIERLDPKINAVVVRDFERARLAARAADGAIRSGELRPLLGVPMTVKESFGMAALPQTWGFEMFRSFVADRDAVAVARLRAAGAVILGKTNVPTMLGDWQSANPIYGRTNNPWDLARSPGGSSGGAAAALAAGYVPLELGSDIGGSIRVPAAFCGVFGHKPSYGLVPTRGHAPAGFDGASPPLAVAGPLARSAEDLEVALDVLAGPDGDMAVGYGLALPPARATRLAGFRVLILDRHPQAATDGAVLAALNGVADDLGRAGAKVTRSHPALPDVAEFRAHFLTLLNAVTRRGQPDAPAISTNQYFDALDAQFRARARWAEMCRDVDVVVAPAFGCVAFPHTGETDWSKRKLLIDDEPTPYGEQLAWPSLALFVNLPATAFPAGLTATGLPIGLQVIGPFLEDRTCLAFAAALERETGRTAQTPPLAQELSN